MSTSTTTMWLPMDQPNPSNLVKLSAVAVIAAAILLGWCGRGAAQDTPPVLPPHSPVWDSRVTPDNISETICNTHYQQVDGRWESWSRVNRPNVEITNALKRRQLEAAVYADKDPAHYEEDHNGPIALGGMPNDPDNLWPQSHFGPWNSFVKDRLEYFAYRHVCIVGDMNLLMAHALFEDWKHSCQQLFGPDPNNCGEAYPGHETGEANPDD